MNLRRITALAGALSLCSVAVHAQVAAVLPGNIKNAAGVYQDVSPTATASWPSADGSTTITTGGTAQALFGGVIPANGFKVAIPSASSGGSPCWLSDSTTTPSATAAGSWPVYQQGQWSSEPNEKPLGPVYLNCPTTGQVVSAKKW